MQDFDSELVPTEGHIPQMAKGSSVGNDSGSKDCVNLPSPTAVVRMILPDAQRASIGVFDSGFGGLTVLKAIRRLMPYENILYLGDTAHLPYGNKSQETILRYCMENTSFLAEQGIKVLVIACNTACCAALDTIRKRLSIPVIGITEQGIAEVIRLFSQGTVGILGTRATIASGLYQRALLHQAPSIHVLPISCPLFVPLVEEGYLDHPFSHLIAHEYLAPLTQQSIQGVLLGCTHYPLLSSVIQSTLGAEIPLIDPAIACAEHTHSLLKEHDLLNPSTSTPSIRFFATDDPEKFRLFGQNLLCHPIDHVLYKPPKSHELQETIATH